MVVHSVIHRLSTLYPQGCPLFIHRVVHILKGEYGLWESTINISKFDG